MQFDEYPPACPSGCENHDDCAECTAAAAKLDEDYDTNFENAEISFDNYPCIECHYCGGRVVAGECRYTSAERNNNAYDTHIFAEVKLCPTCIEDYGGGDVDVSFYVLDHWLLLGS
jgi:hypothetical protein